jgi:hypothetical protein
LAIVDEVGPGSLSAGIDQYIESGH